MYDRVISFDIKRSNKIEKSFRAEKIKHEFDLQENKTEVSFKGSIELPEKWHIGVIVGNSGTGKTTIAKEVFGEQYIDKYEYTASSVIDDMPKNASTEDISNMFSSVGFASVPSWLKPYYVLSNGERMRCDLARALLSDDFVVFDEFTSVVDRRVAETMCLATAKAIRRTNKQIVLVSCHYDILEWLQPDWYFDTNQMKTFFQSSHASKELTLSIDVPLKRGEYSRSIII